MFIVKHRKIFFGFSLILILISLCSLILFGLNLGTDFLGGSILELSFPKGSPSTAEIQTLAASVSKGNVMVQPLGNGDVSLRLRTLTETEKSNLENALTVGGKYQVVEKQFSSIGPSLGTELAQKGLVAIVLVVVLIIIFIAFAFRKVSDPVRSWKYGVIAIIALIHDLIISTGAMSLFAHFFGAEADALFLTALLTILGLSVNDTIVIFDRVRENLRIHSGKTFEESVGISLDQTIVRSINVTLTIVLVLVSMVIFGPASTKFFTLVLTVGMTIGAYSSIFIAAPLLVEWEKSQKAKISAKK